ncbi:MAG: F0F1 ATP synthase subunit B [Gammaproteobacteria bacterium]|nr:F0F1 ATP synthase subunit B [Gammaproteobacteria bacterium]
MDINATLIGQGITFFIFILVTMKFVWPPIMQAMQERQKKIADGLAAAAHGKHSLEQAKEDASQIMKDAYSQAKDVINQANKRGTEIIEEAKTQARAEGERLIAGAQAQIDQEVSQARESLRKEVANIALAGAGRILEREVDAATHSDLLDKVAGEL